MSTEVSLDWKKALVAAAEAEKGGVGDGVPFISTKAGRMTLGDRQLPNDELECIIMGSTLERTWYDRPYSADDQSPPDCFSLGDKANSLYPHSNVPHPPSTNCAACPMAEFGTALQGKGPACKTRVRLLVMPAPAKITAAMITSKDAEMALLKVFPTSVAFWNGAGRGGKPPGYLKTLANEGMAPWAVVTKVKLELKKGTTYSEMKFSMVRLLNDDKLLAAAYSRLDEAQEILSRPYEYPDEEVGDTPEPAHEEAAGAKY